MASKRKASKLKAASPATLLLLLCFSSPAAAGSIGIISIPDLPDLKDRVHAFRQALRDITLEPASPTHSAPDSAQHLAGDALNLESSFRFTERLERAELDEHPGMPGRRDLVFEEQWLLRGREDDHQRAAKHWMGRRIKGSDLRSHRSDSFLKAKFAWDHGPLVGVGHGPFSVRAGSSQWRLQWSKRWARSSGPWRSRVWVGEDEGEFKAEFLIGRTLLDSYGR